MASAAKLHILPSLALKLQSYNKNEFRSGSCSGSQTGGTRPRRAEQESRPGGRLHIHREHPARLQGHPAGREQQREAGRRVLPPPGGTARCRGRGRCGVAAVREGRAGARGTRSSGCERAGPLLPPFLCRPGSAGAVSPRGAARGGGCTPPPPQKERGAAQSGVLEGEEAGQGARQALQLWQGRPCPAPALRGPCAPGAR